MRRFDIARALGAAAALSLFVASLIHFGYLVEGYEDSGAALPEVVIGAVVAVGLALSWARPPWGRRALIGGLGFGLAGSLLGLVLVLMGVGPQTTPDLVYHLLLVAALCVGLYLGLAHGYGTSAPDPRAKTLR